MVKPQRAPSTKRTHTPLAPVVDVIIVEGGGVVQIPPVDLKREQIGLKAYGLACLPSVWTPPFVVVSGSTTTLSRDALYKAIALAGIRSDRELFIRSSGENESIEQRGSLVSERCKFDDLEKQIAVLASKCQGNEGRIHWVVQEALHTAAKGHLSNERRIAEDKRDWVVEVEASSTHSSEYQKIPLRPWRDDRVPSIVGLQCTYREMVTSRLTEVARWAYERLIRVHFEWVWDGSRVYIVQADPCDDIPGGIFPQELVASPTRSQLTLPALKAFRVASATDYAAYRKLGNVKLYQDLGYTTTPFYVLDDQEILKQLFQHSCITDALLHDLEALTCRPLVIRTDGASIPETRRTMLPRSDELRSLGAAKNWLLKVFSSRVNEIANDKEALCSFRLCLIAHHFVPAVASAWCQARPDNRRVRIESLWGIPEGLYWYAYDAFDVDTQVLTLSPPEPQPQTMLVRERLRYKEHFVAPDSVGNWVLHRTGAGPDWQRSITQRSWINEIAWISRSIATKLGRPVVVMWFIDIPSSISKHRVIPWHHEDWKLEGTLHKAAPRKKNPNAFEFYLHTRADWSRLNSLLDQGEKSISRVIVAPQEPELVRDADFLKALGKLAKEKSFVIQLGGGILSHAYYMLSSAGCAVECVDLDDYALGDESLSFNKLVRDKIPQNIIDRGENVVLLKLQGEALIAALKRKIVEESLEVLDARNNEQIVEELADLQEVMRALMSRLDISNAVVEQARKRKEKQRGAFDSALMLSKTTIAAPLSMPGLDTEGALPTTSKNIVKTISLAAEIPSPIEDFHLDKRFSSSGIEECQFSTVLPAHVESCTPAQISFSLSAPNGVKHGMVLELQTGRHGPDVQLKIRLINAPTQMKFDFEPEVTTKVN